MLKTGNIYLVGFMGTGKTAVGTALAKQLKWQFVDLDTLIELRERRQITEIFAKAGEPYFRRIEKVVLKDVAKENKFVVACGGGIVLDPENIRLMKESGRAICLLATPEVILKRASGTTHRPLLNVKDPKKQIGHLLKLRAPYYAKADCQIDTSKLTIEQVVKMIAKQLQAKVKTKKRR
jgi:shikimate kinase